MPDLPFSDDAGVWLCEYPGLSFQRSPVCALTRLSHRCSSAGLRWASSPRLRNQLILSDKCWRPTAPDYHSALV